MGHSPPFVARYGASTVDIEGDDHAQSTGGNGQRKHISKVLVIAGFFFFLLAAGLVVGDVRLEGFLLHQQDLALVDNSKIVIDVVVSDAGTLSPTTSITTLTVSPTTATGSPTRAVTVSPTATVTVPPTIAASASPTITKSTDGTTVMSTAINNQSNNGSESSSNKPRPKAASDDPSRKLSRTICTLMKDEVQFVDEWITFHARQGWNRIVIYDDGSTDGTREALSKYPSHLVEVRNVTWPKPTSSRYGFTTLQEKAFPDCFVRYWNVSSVLINLDVDEFIYPEEPFWQSDDPLWEGFVSAKLVDPNRTVLVQYPLIDFGFGNHTDTPNGSVVQAYTQRMPITKEEDANYTGQHKQALLKSPTPGKVLYFPNGVANVILPSVHYPAGGWQQYKPVQASTFKINHYRFRSIKHLMAKFQKNKYGGSLTRLPTDHPTSALRMIIPFYIDS